MAQPIIRIGVIGCGNMGQALIARLSLRASRFALSICDIDTNRSALLAKRYGADTALDNADLAKRSDVVLIAVKPKDVSAVLDECRPAMNADKVVISIAAGITTRFIESRLGAVPVIRAMPNLPATIGEAMTSVSAGTSAGPKHLMLATEIMKAVGDVVEVEEDVVDAVTAISGSGPAYFYYYIEALIDAAVDLGIERSRAKDLVMKTALGGIHLLRECGDDPAALREKVTSRGGTTEAAIKTFESSGLKGLVKDAVAKAVARAREMSRALPCS